MFLLLFYWVLFGRRSLLIMVILRVAPLIRVLNWGALLPRRRRLSLGRRNFACLVSFLTSRSLYAVLLSGVYGVLRTVLCGMTAIDSEIMEVSSTADTVHFLVLVSRWVRPVYDVWDQEGIYGLAVERIGGSFMWLGWVASLTPLTTLFVRHKIVDILWGCWWIILAIVALIVRLFVPALA
jgi:hypothetical protein